MGVWVLNPETSAVLEEGMLAGALAGVDIPVEGLDTTLKVEVGQVLILRDWSLIIGRGGGYKMLL